MLPSDEYGNKTSKDRGDPKKYKINEWWERYTPFETLVSIILSQRMYWKNVRTATERFSERFNGIEDVAKANERD
ncbi:MAG: hypothetical protein OCU22_01540 [Canidatus Methanoxibalbensis ujae]|nr:hypothetical protein [Candidatus Methanoxibalbensis ujae]